MDEKKADHLRSVPPSLTAAIRVYIVDFYRTAAGAAAAQRPVLPL